MSQIYFGMKLYVFRTVPLSIIRGLFTVHSAMVYVIQVCRQLSSRAQMVPSWSCSKAVYKPVWHIPLLNVQWINPWWWTEELSETRRVSRQNKFVELVHLVGFIIKKYFNCNVIIKACSRDCTFLVQCSIFTWWHNHTWIFRNTTLRTSDLAGVFKSLPATSLWMPE
jgi:hypothetical protein